MILQIDSEPNMQPFDLESEGFFIYHGSFPFFSFDTQQKWTRNFPSIRKFLPTFNKVKIFFIPHFYVFNTKKPTKN